MTWQIPLDSVLSPEEQLELAERLRADSGLSHFFGTVGGLVTEEETDERWCDVVGVADEERQVIYPKTITYVYDNRQVTLVDTDSSFFDGKELTTMRFEGRELHPRPGGVHACPKELLDQWQEVAQEVDLLFDSLDFLTGLLPPPSAPTPPVIPCPDGTLFGYGFSYIPTHRIIEELKPTALFTLLAAVAMALFTEPTRQRQALQRERDFARAAAHELKTPWLSSGPTPRPCGRTSPRRSGSSTWTWCSRRATAWPPWWATCWSCPGRRASRRKRRWTWPLWCGRYGLLWLCPWSKKISSSNWSWRRCPFTETGYSCGRRWKPGLQRPALCRAGRHHPGGPGARRLPRSPHRLQRRAQDPGSRSIPALGALLPRRPLPQPGQRRHRPGACHCPKGGGGPRRTVLGGEPSQRGGFFH